MKMPQLTRRSRSAGFQTCCIADFQIGRPYDVVPRADLGSRAETILTFSIQNQKSKIKNLNTAAFTLMEVMIAIGVFCVGALAILGLVASVLHGARLLDKPMVDSSVVAGEVADTNAVVDLQTYSGDLSEFLGQTYNGYSYVYGINEVESNHLYEVDIAVTSDAPGKPVTSKMSVLLFRPLSPPGHLDFGFHQ
jgi:prepilin-type N-terminal cleavage/methylation domain-containing protein